MRGGVIILIVALFIVYMGVTGKYCCFTQFIKCVMSDSAQPCECGAKEGQATVLLPGGSLPKLPKLPSLLPMSTLT